MSANHVVLVVALLLGIGCDKVPKSSSPKNDQPKINQPKIDQKVTIEISVESLIVDAVRKDKADVEAAHQKGNKNVVGLMNGTQWLGLDRGDRVYYVRGISDFHSFNSEIGSAAIRAVESERKAKGLGHVRGEESSFGVGRTSVGTISSRLDQVISGPSFGDLTDAITKFYQNNPLLKDRPVLWVLSVALYKELKASRPIPAKGSVDEDIAQYDDTVSVSLKKSWTMEK